MSDAGTLSPEELPPEKLTPSQDSSIADAEKGSNSVAQDLSLAALWLSIGLGGLFFSFSIDPSTLGNNRDPGPRFFPVVLSMSLCAGGLAQLVLCLREFWAPRRQRKYADKNENNAARTNDVPTGRGLLRLGALGILLVAYLLAIGHPQIGFTFSTGVFVTVTVLMLGGRLMTAIATAIVLPLFVRVLFVWCFEVQVPDPSWLF